MASLNLQTNLRGSSPISTFVFLDLESTGLLDQPNCRITELCMIAVHRNDLTKDLPRVMNKLTICFNPKTTIAKEAERVSGLSNKGLKDQRSFKNDTVDLIRSFLRHLRRPVCFLAHNGNGFDFPLILGEIGRCGQPLDEGLLCADTLEAFKSLESSTPRRLLPVAGASCGIQPLNKPQKSSSELKDVTTVLERRKSTPSAKGDTKKPRQSLEHVSLEHKGVTEVPPLNKPQKASSKLEDVTTVSGKRKSTLSAKGDTKKPKHSLEHVSAIASTSQSRGYDYAQSSTIRSTPLTRQGVSQSTSNKLQDIYCRHFDEKHPNAHSAEGDCIAMLKIAGCYPKFADWVDQNAVRLSLIMPATI